MLKFFVLQIYKIISRYFKKNPYLCDCVHVHSYEKHKHPIIMKKKITIIGAGMMGSALAFPAAENGHEVHIVGTCLDDEIIDGYISTGKHEKFCRPFPENVQYHYFKDWKEVVKGSDFVIGGVSSFGVDWFLEEILTQLDPDMPVLSVTKGLRATEDGTLLSYPGYWESELAKRGIKRVSSSTLAVADLPNCQPQSSTSSKEYSSLSKNACVKSGNSRLTRFARARKTGVRTP